MALTKQSLDICFFRILTRSLFCVLIIPSSLKKTISYIICSSSQKKMAGANTVANIAAMTNHKMFGDWPILNSPCKSMRSARFMINVKSAIPRRNMTPNPYPTSGCFFYVIPKIFSRIFRHHIEGNIC